MCNVTSMGIAQALFAAFLIPDYFICAYNKFLWFEVFYKFEGWKTKCSNSTNWRDKSNPCDLYNGIYTILNTLICLASMIASIGVATHKRNANIQTRRNTLLVWLIVDIIFLLHLVLLHILSINSILIKARSIDANSRFDVFINSMALTTFTTSMIAAFGFLVFGFYQYIKLHINYKGDLQEQVEKRIREAIERNSEKKRRLREHEMEPIKKL